MSVLATRKRTYTVRALLRDAVAVGARLDRVLAIWMGQRVPAPLREQLMVAVARANACGTCIWVHGAWARWTGVSEARLRALADDDEDAFDVRTWVALQYVRALVESDGGPVAPALLAQTEARFGPEGARDLETITRVMTLANRTNNTVDAFVARLRGRPSTGSRWFDEVLVALMAAIASVPTRVGLSLARRGPKGARPLARRAGRP